MFWYRERKDEREVDLGESFAPSSRNVLRSMEIVGLFLFVSSAVSTADRSFLFELHSFDFMFSCPHQVL